MPPLPKTQKALQINCTGGPEVLEVNSFAPLPKITDNQILVKNSYAGLNYIDTYFRAGLYTASSFPYTLGQEGEGSIVAVGSNVTDFKVGDYVGYIGVAVQAEYTCVDLTKAIRVPDGIEQGVTSAALLQGLTALTLIMSKRYISNLAGDAILVHAAAGGVGLWLLQLLRIVGARTIIATASTVKKLELATQNGATHCINHSIEDWVTRVKEITNGKGVNAVFDGVGKVTFEGDLQVLAPKGSLVSFGNSSGQVPPLSIARLAPKCLKVLRPQLFGYVATKEEFASYAGEVLDLVKRKKVEVRIHKTYSLDEAQQAHTDIEGRVTIRKLLYKL
ncbi:hypothetical protein K440DRAFT_563703 [Wilcoxina mikolae CBS 423.85]|nr:hypothetical protein K440DRAFT_563703 [Wilcoxina mikolae CBS 423.85]